MAQDHSSVREDIIFGRNSVTEALKSNRPADSLLVAAGERGGSVTAIVARAKQRGITVKEVSATKLDYMTGGGNHQGVVLLAAVRPDCSFFPCAAAMPNTMDGKPKNARCMMASKSSAAYRARRPGIFCPTGR